MNDLEWEPSDKHDVVPPEEFFTNENISDFFIELFRIRGKPSVQQAHKWLNHALAQYHRPSVNNNNYQHYASVLDVLRGMSKDDKLKNNKTKGADALTKEAVKKIFEAPIHDPRRRSSA